METVFCSEPELISAARVGDKDAFSTLAQQHYSRIYRLALRLTKSHEDAEDSVQEALLKAYCHLNTFQGGSRFYTWLARITMNEALMKLRKRHSDKQVYFDTLPQEFQDHHDNPEKQYADAELQEAFGRAISALSPTLSSAFVLRNVQECTVKETAQTLGLSQAAVKSRLVRARRRLRQTLHGRRTEAWTSPASSLGACVAEIRPV
ncbi:MAG: RNA polymerase sigma factor [Terriglobia bacterium]